MLEWSLVYFVVVSLHLGAVSNFFDSKHVPCNSRPSCCRVGVVFCGRQSPGGHNVIWGLHSAIKSHNPNSTLLGFVGKY